MDPAVFTVSATATVGDVLACIERAPELLKQYIYAVDGDEKLVGVLSLPQLLALAPGVAVRDIMQSNVVHLPVTATEDEIARSRHWRRYAILPVVDRGGILAGQIRHSAIWNTGKGQPGQRLPDTVLETVLALGELYWLGVTELLTIPTFQWVGRREKAPGGSTSGRKP
jgi:CBS domain-containing protein